MGIEETLRGIVKVRIMRWLHANPDEADNLGNAMQAAAEEIYQPVIDLIQKLAIENGVEVDVTNLSGNRHKGA